MKGGSNIYYITPFAALFYYTVFNSEVDLGLLRFDSQYVTSRYHVQHITRVEQISIQAMGSRRRTIVGNGFEPD